jgi:uncharacterized membrane protein YdbT with pleckstrin-like domain
MQTMSDMRQQAVTGVVPPQVAEAVIRIVWPSVTVFPAVANLGQRLIRSVVLAPLGWMVLLPIYFLKVLPFLARRYALTNRRLMIQRGLKFKTSAEVSLADIDAIRIDANSINSFFRAADLEVVSKGKVVLRLPGVPDPESFRWAVLNACVAWVPGKAATLVL